MKCQMSETPVSTTVQWSESSAVPLDNSQTSLRALLAGTTFPRRMSLPENCRQRVLSETIFHSPPLCRRGRNLGVYLKT